MKKEKVLEETYKSAPTTWFRFNLLLLPIIFSWFIYVLFVGHIGIEIIAVAALTVLAYFIAKDSAVYFEITFEPDCLTVIEYSNSSHEVKKRYRYVYSSIKRIDITVARGRGSATFLTVRADTKKRWRWQGVDIGNLTYFVQGHLDKLGLTYKKKGRGIFGVKYILRE